MAVLVVAHQCDWSPPAVSAGDVPGDERGLDASGWSLVADVEDGRIYAKGDRSCIVTDEPDGFELNSETVGDRVRRLGAAGWTPIVSWRGSPRGAQDMLALVEARAVANGNPLRTVLAGLKPVTSPQPAPGLKTPKNDTGRFLPVTIDDVPESPHPHRTFEDVVWRLKWMREERLLKANPDLKACLLTDERIAGLIRMDIVDNAEWNANFRGVIRHGIDPAQLASRETVFAIVDTMPVRAFRSETPEAVAAVAYPAPKAPVPAPAPEITIEPMPQATFRVRPIRPPAPAMPVPTVGRGVQERLPFASVHREVVLDAPRPGMH